MGVFLCQREVKSGQKIRIAKECLHGFLSQSAAAEQIGVDMTAVMDWGRLYQSEGAQAFLPKEGTRWYDPLVKEMAVKDDLSGKGSLREICKIYKIRSTCQLRTWIKVDNGHKDFKEQTGGSRMTKGR